MSDELREVAQAILDRCLDFFGEDDLDPESSEAMPVVIKNRWVYELRAALSEEAVPVETTARLRAAIDNLPRLRITGEQLDAIDPDPEKVFYTDWDEWDEYVRLDAVRAALAASTTEDET